MMDSNYSNLDSAIADADYETINMNFTFVVNSTDGDMQCMNVTINDDTLVEGDEAFSVKLNLFTMGVFVTLRNNRTATIIIIDNEGKIDLTVCIASSLIFN